MTKLNYLTDSYIRTNKAIVTTVRKHGHQFEVILDKTIFYPEGGGQPSDKGKIFGKRGIFEVTHARMKGEDVIHEGKLEGKLVRGEQVELMIDWQLRYDHMRRHSAGHLVHEIVHELLPGLVPVKGEHGRNAYIEYEGVINPKLAETIEKRVNMLVASGKELRTEMVTLEELKNRASWIPLRLPKNKPLRILTVGDYPPIPDGGTQVRTSDEVGEVKITQIEQLGPHVRVHYILAPSPLVLSKSNQPRPDQKSILLSLNNFQSLLLEQQEELMQELYIAKEVDLEPLYVRYFGSHGKSTELIKHLRELPQKDRKNAGLLVNEYKESILKAFEKQKSSLSNKITTEWFDTSLPGIKPPEGHLHLVSQAISEITRIFEKIGFTRVRHPEIDWDWYAFGSLNMPPNHPARDEWETFFIEYPGEPLRHPRESEDPQQERILGQAENDTVKRRKIVLTPHTSNGQVREMEKRKLPIRMINIAKCYRRQVDVSHTAMFHQFEGLYVDKNVSIGHLKGVMDFFFKQYYGPERKSRLRPFHFQFTEPSFEVDVNCGICLGKGCKLCKDGWLELGGAGMVHPNVLKSGGIDAKLYNGFAFGWGIERVAMMKSGTQIDDIRLLYSNDLRFLEQF